MSLRIDSITVEGFRCIDNKTIVFPKKGHIAFIGRNGTGKSTILNLLATIAGNDHATNIFAGHLVGSIEVKFTLDDEIEMVYLTRDQLDRKSIMGFKSQLQDCTRINYAIHENNVDKFRCDSDDFATFSNWVRQHINTNRPFLTTYKPGNRDIRVLTGDGTKRAFLLFCAMSYTGGPILLDNPSAHLHITNSGVIGNALRGLDVQVISASHDPEWMHCADTIIEF